MKIDIGCGEFKREGYAGVDLLAGEGVDFVVDVTKEALPFEDCSVDAVSTSHFLEHITYDDAVKVLSEAHRVLRKGGEIEIVVPNFPRLLELFLAAEFENKWVWWIQTIFGNQDSAGQYHKDGYDADKLHLTLEALEFVEIAVEEVWTHQQPCLRATARKKNVSLLV